MTYISVMFALLANAQEKSLPTFEEVEAAKVQAFRTQARFLETVILTIQNGQGKSVVKRSLLIDGRRLLASAESGGQRMWETGSDGKQWWTIMYPAKVYASGSVDKAEEAGVPAHSHPGNLTPGECSFELGSDQPLRVRSNPPFQVASLEAVRLDGKPARLLMAESAGPQEHRNALVKQWFYSDTWFLCRLEVTGTDRHGKPLNVLATFTTGFKPKVEDALFRFDAKKVEGFTKVEMPPPAYGL